MNRDKLITVTGSIIGFLLAGRVVGRRVNRGESLGYESQSYRDCPTSGSNR